MSNFFLFYLFHILLFTIAAINKNRTNLDRPMCRADQKRIYGVARNEMAKILCEVDSFPPPTSFKWSFNNTAETIDMPQNGFEKFSRTSSKLTYTPVKVIYQSFRSLFIFILFFKYFKWFFCALRMKMI